MAVLIRVAIMEMFGRRGFNLGNFGRMHAEQLCISRKYPIFRLKRRVRIS